MSKERQPNLSIYNAYTPGLFGLHHSEADVAQMSGVSVEKYNENRTFFVGLCNRLGGRVLNAMYNGSALVTPEKIDPGLVDYMAKVLNVDIKSVLMLSLEDSGPGSVRPDDLPARMLNDNGVMDSLRKWAKIQVKPIISPRTTTPDTIQLARELNMSHMVMRPNSLSQGRFAIADGIYPTLDYIESHPAEKNNSKVLNYLILKELDKKMNTNFAPEGDVATSIDGVIKIAKGLLRSGKDVIIKADLSVDGAGNIHFTNRNKNLQKTFLDMDHGEQRNYILSRLTNSINEAGQLPVPVSEKAPVIVSEFLTDKIYDPSVEIYSPPKEWGIGPQLYYDCGMIIGTGFEGSIVPDPVEFGNEDLRKPLEKFNIPAVLINRKDEYRKLLIGAKKMIKTFSEQMWADGYVGISDCDLAVCVDKNNGRMSIKILEFNYNRETGGTATFQIKERLGKSVGSTGFVVARDSIISNEFYGNFERVYSWAKKNSVDFLEQREGLLILGQKNRNGGNKGEIMSLIFAPTLEKALEWDIKVRQLANK